MTNQPRGPVTTPSQRKPPPKKCFDVDEMPVTEELDQVEDLSDREGFDRDFLSIRTPMPTFKPGIASDSVAVDGSTDVKYEHFSLAMSKERRMARWVAWNIDGTTLLPEGSIDRVGFRADHRLQREQQITNYVYDQDNHLDRGHVSRRADLLWGAVDEATRANKDSFYYTNITPQMEAFNQSGRGGLWGCLENAVYEQAKTGHRINVFGGPILEAGDVAYEDIRVPDEFWKLLVYVVDGAPRARAFILQQVVENIDKEAIELPKWEPFAKTVAHISDRTSLDFGEIAEWDAREPVMDTEEVETPIRDLSAIDW